MTPLLYGSIPVLVTPFDQTDAIDIASLRNELDFLIGHGVTMVAFGFGSEVFRLSDDERLAALVAAAAHDSALGVIAHVSASSSEAGVVSARAAAEAGAAGVMVPAPPIITVSDEALLDHYGAIASVGLPVVVQDAPAVTGAELSVELIARLTAVPGIVGIKVEASPSVPKIEQLAPLCAPGVALIGGSGGQDLIAELDRGATATMPGPSLPESFAAIVADHAAGDSDAAQARFQSILPLIVASSRSMDTFLWMQKEILRRRGVLPSARLRRPHELLSTRLAAELDDLLAQLGPLVEVSA
jgi:2-keto-3-deoxy-L-arabinonate dehydratase